MKMFTCTCAQDEVTHQRLRVGVQKNSSSKAAAMCTRGAYADYVSRKNGENAAGGFFQQTP